MKDLFEIGKVFEWSAAILYECHGIMVYFSWPEQKGPYLFIYKIYTNTSKTCQRKQNRGLKYVKTG